jgi:hypothetical protein
MPPASCLLPIQTCRRRLTEPSCRHPPPLSAADICRASWPPLSSLLQELYSRPALASVARRMLSVRYSLLPYLYTLLKDATQTGAPLFRPLFMNFPGDRLTYPISKWVLGWPRSLQ